jgi:FkbM family methyltransferase
VEPVAKNFEMLSRNCLLNKGRFKTRREAIARRSGQEVVLKTDPLSISNAGASVVKPEQTEPSNCLESIRTISIDDLSAGESCAEKPVVIKLDVEGMEIDAIKGGKNTINRDTLLIYEDHGKDYDCRATDYVLSLGLSVFFCDRNIFKKIVNINDVRAMKKQTSVGYNLFAFREETCFSRYFPSVPVGMRGPVSSS